VRSRVLPILGVLLVVACASNLRPRAVEPDVPIYAVWPHSDYKPWQASRYGRDPAHVLQELGWMREVGINRYLPLALASGRVNWPSDRFPDTRDLYGVSSPLDVAVRGGAARGIATELYLLMGFVGALEDPWAAPDLRAHPEWDVVGANGNGTLSGEAEPPSPWGRFLWWDLGHPAVQARLLGMLDEALERYPTAAGIHLDYIRTPAVGGCFSDACLARFQRATGIVVPETLEDAAGRAQYITEHHEEAHIAWRAGELTEFVRRIRTLVKQRRPAMTVAADVFAHAGWAYRGVFQDWQRWAAEGLVDAVYPMFYRDARAQWDVAEYVRDTVATLDRRAAAQGHPRAAVVVGLATGWDDPLAPEEAADLISRARAGGANGVALQMLPYWWQTEYHEFRQYYLPQSVDWPALPDYDAVLRQQFQGGHERPR